MIKKLEQDDAMRKGMYQEWQAAIGQDRSKEK
jgi:hypothetical protein